MSFTTRPELRGTFGMVASTPWLASAAASKALPPRSSTDIPAADASQWVDVTMPNVPRSSGLVVKFT